MTEHAAVRFLSLQEARKSIPALSAVLIDCVEGGDSVGFMAPLAREKADAFWWGVTEGVEAGERILLAAEDPASGAIVGTVQVVLGQPENQPHRADVAKTLVHRRARRRGLGPPSCGPPKTPRERRAKPCSCSTRPAATRSASTSAWGGRGSVRCQATPYCPTDTPATPRSSTSPSRRAERNQDEPRGATPQVAAFAWKSWLFAVSRAGDEIRRYCTGSQNRPAIAEQEEPRGRR